MKYIWGQYSTCFKKCSSCKNTLETMRKKVGRIKLNPLMKTAPGENIKQ